MLDFVHFFNQLFDFFFLSDINQPFVVTLALIGPPHFQEAVRFLSGGSYL